MSSDSLLNVATDLLRVSPGTPSRAALNRAVSTAHYALFHILCGICVDRLIGWRNRSDRYWDVVTPIYRLVDHGGAKRVFAGLAASQASSPALRRVALIFLELQAARILADDDPQPRFDRGDALHRIQQATRAMEDLRTLSADERRLLAVQLITRPR